MIDNDEESKKDAERFAAVLYSDVSLHFRIESSGCNDPDEAAAAARDAAILSLVSFGAEDDGSKPIDSIAKRVIVHDVVRDVRNAWLLHMLDCSSCYHEHGCPELAQALMAAAFAAAPEAPKRYVIAALVGTRAALSIERRDRDRHERDAEDRDLQRRLADGSVSRL